MDDESIDHDALKGIELFLESEHVGMSFDKQQSSFLQLVTSLNKQIFQREKSELYGEIRKSDGRDHTLIEAYQAMCRK